jgi:hypothetical protein
MPGAVSGYNITIHWLSTPWMRDHLYLLAHFRTQALRLAGWSIADRQLLFGGRYNLVWFEPKLLLQLLQRG